MWTVSNHQERMSGIEEFRTDRLLYFYLPLRNFLGEISASTRRLTMHNDAKRLSMLMYSMIEYLCVATGVSN